MRRSIPGGQLLCLGQEVGADGGIVRGDSRAHRLGNGDDVVRELPCPAPLLQPILGKGDQHGQARIQVARHILHIFRPDAREFGQELEQLDKTMEELDV